MIILNSNLLFLLLSPSLLRSSKRVQKSDLLCYLIQHPDRINRCGDVVNGSCILSSLLGVVERESSAEKLSDQSKVIKLANSPSACTTSAHSLVKVDYQLLLDMSKKCRSHNNLKFWLVLRVRNDAQIVLEWLIWHFLIGVNHVLLFDNGSTDNLNETVSKFQELGLVTKFYHPDSRRVGQRLSYDEAVKYAKGKGVEWMGAIDIDEYLAPFKHGCVSNIVQPYQLNSSVGAVAVNWRYIPPTGEVWRPRDEKTYSIVENFVDRTRFCSGIPNAHIKSILRVKNAEEYVNMHYALLNNGTFSVSAYRGARVLRSVHKPERDAVEEVAILHTRRRSLEEWIFKKQTWGYSSTSSQCPECFKSLEALMLDWTMYETYDTFNNSNNMNSLILSTHFWKEGRSNNRKVLPSLTLDRNVTSLKLHDVRVERYMRTMAASLHKIIYI